MLNVSQARVTCCDLVFNQNLPLRLVIIINTNTFKVISFSCS